MAGNLKDFMDKHGIKRIDFDAIEMSDAEEEFATDKLVCPYCGCEMELMGEEYDDVLKGTAYQCEDCEKWFYVEAEMSINTTCKPMEDYLLEPWVKRNIQGRYDHDDQCNEKGMIWDLDNKFQYIEWQTYKEYAEPLFENMKIDKEKETNG